MSDILNWQDNSPSWANPTLKEETTNVIKFSETTPEFRKGFEFACKAIADMGLSETYSTKAAFIDQIKLTIHLIDSGFFWNNLKFIAKETND